MKIFHHSFSVTSPLPEEFYNGTDVFFDIETTGLDWRKSHVFLIAAGIYRPDLKTFEITQWFADEPSRETDLLHAFSEFLKPFRRLIHYNGTGFDLPYLRKKYAFYKLVSPLDTLDTLDLYRIFFPFRGLFRLSSQKLKHLETFAGFQRQDLLSGKEVIGIYRNYMTEADSALLNLLLLHNLEDVKGLLHILSLYGFPSLLCGHFHISVCSTDTELLSLILRPDTGALSNLHFSGNFGVLTCNTSQMTIKITGEQRELKYFYTNYKDYYYLPLEDTAIHKSVGSYVDPSHREKAKAANCYQRRFGLYFPQPSEIITPAFRESLHSRILYFEWDDSHQNNPDLMKQYARSMFSYFCKEAASLADSSSV